MEKLCYKPLTVDNLFDFCNVLQVVGVERILSALTDGEKQNRNPEQVGTQALSRLAGMVIRALPGAREQIYTFLAGCLQWNNGEDVTVLQLRQMGPAAFVRVIKGLFRQECMMDFFAEVAAFADMEGMPSSSCYTAATATRNGI